MDARRSFRVIISFVIHDDDDSEKLRHTGQVSSDKVSQTNSSSRENIVKPKFNAGAQE